MIANTTWEFQDNLEPHSPTKDPLAASFDEDLLNAALLFLDHEDVVTDSDSHSSHTTIETENHDVISRARERNEQRSGGIRSHSSVEANSNEPPPTARRRVNKRRQEIEALRAQSKVLQTRLRMLKRKPSTKMSIGPGLFMIAPLGSSWEAVASQEFEERERVESENQRLKALVAENKRIALALQQAASQRMDLQAQELVQRSSQRPQTPRDIELSLQVPNLMDVLLEAVDPMISQTDAVLSNTLGRTLNTERHGDSHLTVQIQDTRIVPVGVATTVSVMWEHALLQEDLNHLHWTMVREDTLQSEFVSHAEFPGFRGQAMGKLVVRRVEQANRTVIVRSAVFHCRCGHLKNRFLIRPMRQFLWTVIDRPPHLGVIPGEDSISRVRTCAISLPRLDVGDLGDASGLSRDAEIEDLLRLNILISTHQCDKAIDSVDNKLLGRARNPSGQMPSDCSWRMVQDAC